MLAHFHGVCAVVGLRAQVGVVQDHSAISWSRKNVSIYTGKYGKNFTCNFMCNDTVSDLARSVVGKSLCQAQDADKCHNPHRWRHPSTLEGTVVKNSFFNFLDFVSAQFRSLAVVVVVLCWTSTGWWSSVAFCFYTSWCRDASFKWRNSNVKHLQLFLSNLTSVTQETSKMLHVYIYLDLILSSRQYNLSFIVYL